MRNKLCLLLFSFILLVSFSHAQDLIRTQKDTIKAKVLEIGLDEIRYKNFDYQDGPVIVIQKSSVKEIIYENGTKFLVTPDPYDANQTVQARGKTHAIKFEFLSPVTGDLGFGYESMIKVGTNLELKLGIIGPGFTENKENAGGFWVKGGVKFLKSPTYVQNGLKYAHPLHGSYIKPEIIINNYSADAIYETPSNTYPYYYTYETKRVNFTNLAVNIVFGRQSILGNVITIDYYIGLGYGVHFTNQDSNALYSEDDGEHDYVYSHAYFSYDSPLIATAGLVLGYIY